jgi:hypothetical protein
MIGTKELQKRVLRYRNSCRDRHTEPTYTGLAFILGISGKTIRNVVNGTYNGHRYTEHPHSTRCICNDDFETIRTLFQKRGSA